MPISINPPCDDFFPGRCALPGHDGNARAGVGEDVPAGAFLGAGAAVHLRPHLREARRVSGPANPYAQGETIKGDLRVLQYMFVFALSFVFGYYCCIYS